MNAKHVMVVDDNVGTYRIATFLLQIRGHQVTEVTSLEDAISGFTFTQNDAMDKFDLILINNLLCPSEPLRVLTQFGEPDLNIPILIINRSENRDFIETLPLTFFQQGSVALCEPELVCDSLELLLEQACC